MIPYVHVLNIRAGSSALHRHVVGIDVGNRAGRSTRLGALTLVLLGVSLSERVGVVGLGWRLRQQPAGVGLYADDLSEIEPARAVFTVSDQSVRLNLPNAPLVVRFAPGNELRR